MKNTKFILKLAAILFTIVFLCTLILVVCNDVTAPVIAELKVKSENEARLKVLPQADGEFEKVDASGIAEAYRGTDKDGNFVGYSFKVETSGFGGIITMMVGVDTKGRVTGVEITDMAETPGLGANATNATWLGAFKDKTSDIEVVKGGNAGENQIDALSGATITSKAVTDGVNTALDVASKLMSKEGK